MPTIERGLTISFGLCLLVLMAALPLPAQAKDGPPGPDGLPVANPRHPWNTFTGTPRVDTLSFTPRDVLPIARRQIENDQWEVFTLDAARGTIVTRWKAMHHPLLLLFVGHVNARCTVTVQPLGDNRTRMVFRADLASHGNLEESPFLGRAKSAYAKAASNYFSKVRYSLSTRSMPRPRATTSRRLAPRTAP